MLATADCTNNYTEKAIYDSEWTENTPTGLSWLNLLTSQPIPEEADGMDGLHTPVRNNSESNCSSSSSVDSCYVVLEIQRPRSVDETSSKIEEEEEEEEELEEVIEELHFAQMHNDNHNVLYEQLAVSMITEAPMEEYVVQYRQEHIIDVGEYAKVIQPTIQETSNDTLFHKAKTLSRFTKRIKAMSHISMKEQNCSTSSDDEPLNITKLKTIRKLNEYHPIAISTVAAEQQSTTQNSNSSRYSTTSLDSIENKSLSSSPIHTPPNTTTFSNLASQRTINPTHIQRSAPAMGTTTLIRTFAFDRACMEKYGRVQQQKNEPIEISTRPIREPIIQEEVELSTKIPEQSKLSSLPDNTLNCRSFTNTISTPLYTDNETSTVDDSESENHLSMHPLPSGTQSLSKASSIFCLMKKYARTVSSEYRLNHNINDENISTEPTLLEVKYLDGRLPLKDDHARESFRKGESLFGSVSNRLNRLGLSKMSSTQDLSSTSSSSSFNGSFRKRMVNRFRTLIENNSTESSQSRPWQHKTMSELFSERKYKVNHHQ